MTAQTSSTTPPATTGAEPAGDRRRKVSLGAAAFLPLDGADHADCLRSLYALVREASADDGGSSAKPGGAEQCGPTSSTGAILAGLSAAAAKMPERSARRGRSAA